VAYIGNQPTTVAFLTDQFNGTGSQTAFTLSAAPANTASIIVAVSGVLQDPTTYSVSGTTLTFSAAPPSGTGNISVRFLGIPASGVVTTAYRTQTEFTATAGQTTFSVPSYTVGFIDVYRNGALLGSADFTATNGTTVVLAAGASAGDLVETVSFSVSSVLNAIPAVANAVTDTYLNTGAVTTTKIANANVTPAKLSQPFTSGTAVASTSGTSIDFTGIPSWVKRITIMFDGVSLNSAASIRVQLGVSGTPETSGYLSGSSVITNVPSATFQFSTNGIDLFGAVASYAINGSLIFTTLGSNVWTFMGNTYNPNTVPYVQHTAGSKTLAGVLNMVRITTSNGTDTFDAGTINILYE
jgi:hypothetical protein